MIFNYFLLFKRDLLENAWDLLKPGGLLVYSTCSLSIQQNESNVLWFLLRHRNEANLEPIPVPAAVTKAAVKNVSFTGATQIEAVAPSVMDEIMQMAVRLDPMVSQTSGGFVVRIRKRIAIDEGRGMVQ